VESSVNSGKTLQSSSSSAKGLLFLNFYLLLSAALW
jgi:hypothetical protein